MEPPPIPTAMPPRIPPPVPPAPPVMGALPLPPMGPKKSHGLTKVILIGFCLLVGGFVGFMGVRIYQMRQWNKAHPQHAEGWKFFHDATMQLGPKGPKASGNSEEARKLAGEVSDVMQKLRDEGFSKAKKKALLDTTDTFKTYCELRNDECVFLVHIPELRRFEADAQDELAKEAWGAAEMVLAKEKQGKSGMKVAMGIRGLLLYDRVMMGHWVEKYSDDNTGLEATDRSPGAEKGLYDWFEPTTTTVDSVKGTVDEVKPTLKSAPEILSEADEGFKDLVLFVQEQKQDADGSQWIRAAGLYKGQPVGFEVMIGAGWRNGAKGIAPLEIHSGAVTIRSVGAESDAFVQALDEIYGTKLGAKAMNAESKATGISLGGDPGNLAAGPVDIKMFFEPKEKDGYAEFFLNVRMGEKRVEFREKDEEYRAAVVKGLMKP